MVSTRYYWALQHRISKLIDAQGDIDEIMKDFESISTLIKHAEKAKYYTKHPDPQLYYDYSAFGRHAE